MATYSIFRGTWRVMVPGVAESRTRLSDSACVQVEMQTGFSLLSFESAVCAGLTLAAGPPTPFLMLSST